MDKWHLERLRLSAGRWEGRLAGPAGAEPPPLSATLAGIEVAEPRTVPSGEGEWAVTFALPAAVMTDGTHALAIGPRGGAPLCLETLAFGDPLETDLRAEVAALRAELDILKRAVRRHLAGED